ncbi:prenyltransferase [Panacibacter ginsenosidivorans]|uniref:Prenyltransferase n=1 Tax=Panacibacter ginsenosidivorans TaxID=1813871 RepID=A0A5B8V3S2_9BACT|nr:UbiA prenyltransferase family protein [Panacibacter ginsenosidivorans]QEC66024.1 prenyltransferase [Panacibacter ginsenosidivorans]
MRQIKDWVSLLRIRQYTKNGFVLAPLFFSFSFLNRTLLTTSLYGFFLFSIAASAVYIFNDIFDKKEDAAHPVKCKRPIASGAIKTQIATIIAVLLTLLCLYLSFTLSELFGYMVAIYIFINLLYSVALKRIVILDLMIIAIGFVLRVYAGGFLINVLPSTWLTLMTFLISLILALGKRRDDVMMKNGTEEIIHSYSDGYNIEMLNYSIVAVAGVVIVCYIQYTLSPEIIKHFHNPYLYFNIIFVIAGFLRYFQALFVKKGLSNPSEMILRDRFLQVNIILWLCSFILFID